MMSDSEDVLAYIVELERRYDLKTIAELKEKLRDEVAWLKEEENEALTVAQRRHRRHRRKKKWKHVALILSLFATTWLIGWVISLSFTGSTNVYVLVLLWSMIIGLVAWAMSFAKKV